MFAKAMSIVRMHELIKRRVSVGEIGSAFKQSLASCSSVASSPEPFLARSSRNNLFVHTQSLAKHIIERFDSLLLFFLFFSAAHRQNGYEEAI